MIKMNFSALIQAPPAQVWDAMLGIDTYKIWTEAFCAGSYFVGSWDKGEEIRFLAPNGSGMTSVIAENRLHEFVSIKHLGFVSNGVDDTSSEAIMSWAPAYENYSFVCVGDATQLNIDLDIVVEYEQYMKDTWPVALEKLKAICEGP